MGPCQDDIQTVNLCFVIIISSMLLKPLSFPVHLNVKNYMEEFTLCLSNKPGLCYLNCFRGQRCLANTEVSIPKTWCISRICF